MLPVSPLARDALAGAGVAAAENQHGRITRTTSTTNLRGADMGNSIEKLLTLCAALIVLMLLVGVTVLTWRVALGCQ